jgi:hypothetical protein
MRRVRPFKASWDKTSAETLVDIVGLHLNAPEEGLILCVGEKGQIQAMDCSQPGLPIKIKKGRWGAMAYNYKLNSTMA